jgi:hypothetical protein
VSSLVEWRFTVGDGSDEGVSVWGYRWGLTTTSHRGDSGAVVQPAVGGDAAVRQCGGGATLVASDS